MYWFERLLSGEKNPAAKTKFGFAFVIVTPVFLISCGKRPCAVATRFCTSTAATFRS